MERRFSKFPIKRKQRSDSGPLISGHAAVFYDGTPGTEYQLWPGYVERIMPGAFDRALAEKDDVRGLFNHDSNLILGRTASGTMRLSVDAIGLRYEIDPADTTVANDVQEHLGRRDITGSSFAFNVTDSEEYQDGDVWVSAIRGVKLFDVGPVTYPAYSGTEANARSFEDARRRFAGTGGSIAPAARAAIAAALARARILELDSHH